MQPSASQERVPSALVPCVGHAGPFSAPARRSHVSSRMRPPRGVDSGAFKSSLNIGDDLTVAARDTATFTVSFDPVETGLQTAQLTFNSVTDTTGGAVSGVEAPTVNLTSQGMSTNPRGSGSFKTSATRNVTFPMSCARSMWTR